MNWTTIGRNVGFLAIGLLAACTTLQPKEGRETAPIPSQVQITLLQINDVYEIGAVEGGRRGGLARVATLAKRLRKENPHTFLLHAGDMLSPSAMGTAMVDGKRLDGQQMVAVLNLLGLDFATFGNHEFDLKEGPFLSRLAESRFQWISANVTNAEGGPFPGTLDHVVLPIQTPDGDEVRIGIIGVTIEEKDRGYFRISDPLSAVRREARALRGQVEVLIGLTHLDLDQDVALAEAVPELDLILGGHEHENYQLRRGSSLTPILKADANARSVFVHRITVDRSRGEVEIVSRFLPITDAMPEDPEVAAEVERWTEAAFDGFRRDGFQPEEVVAVATTPLDGRESSVRKRSTALTDLIAEATLAEAAGADLAIYNSGSIRIDDVLPAGPIRQYDVIRVLPFGGPILTVKIPGKVLERALNQGLENKGNGGYLQTANVTGGPGSWKISGEAIVAERVYVVGTSDFLMTGREAGLDFLTFETPGIELMETNRDVRQALIDQLRRTYGPVPEATDANP